MMKRPTLRLALLAALTVSLILAVSANAQTASTASAPSPASDPVESGGTSGVIPWSAIIERPSAGSQAAFDKPGEAGMGAGMNIGNTVKEAIRPIHEGLAQSGVIQSIREFDSDLGGGNRRRENADQDPVRYSSGSPMPVGPTKTTQQIQREQHAASGLLDELVKEATPWAAGLMGVLALGFATKAWMGWLHAKAARPGKLRRSGRRRSRNSTNGSSNSSLQSLGGAPAALDARSAQGLERSSRSSGSSSGSSSASSASGTASGRRRHRSRRPQL